MRTETEQAAMVPARDPAGAPYSVHTGLQASIVGLGLALATLVVFLPALDNGFVNYDDNLYATDTPWLEEGLTVRGTKWAFSRFYASNWHPLTVLSHMLDLELFGLDPRGHHLTSVLLHCANAVLLFAVLRRMTGSQWRSALATALFAVHPLRVESVAWVAERKDVLSTLFALLTLAAYLRFTRRRSALAYSLALVSFALALMAKAMVVTLPFVLLLLDVWPLRRMEPGSVSRRRVLAVVAEKLPLLALALAAGVATILAQSGTIGASDEAPLASRAANAVTSYAAYVGKTIVPRDLAAFYPFPARIAVAEVVGAVALLVGLTAAALVAVRRAPYFTVGWFWFVGTLAPVIGLFKVGNQAMADRYTYLPSIGLALAATWGLHELVGRRFPRSSAAAALAAVLVLAGLTRVQIGHWASGSTLFRHALEVTGDNYLAHLNLGEALHAEGDHEGSLRHYRAAAELRPDLATARAGLGEVMRSRGETEEAVAHLAAASELDPRDVRIRYSLAMALSDLGRVREAMDELRTIVDLEPGYVWAHWGLGDLLLRQGDLGGARSHLERAFAADRPKPELALVLSWVLVRQGDPAAAQTVLQHTLALHPRSESLRLALTELSILRGSDRKTEDGPRDE